MIPPSGGPKPDTLEAFYDTMMRPRGTESKMPKFESTDHGLVKDIRMHFQNGNLTKAELGMMAEKVEDENARAFLNRLSSNPKSARLKTELAAEGISLTDQSDVGDGERFASLTDKANYIGDRFTYSVMMIIPNIVAYGWGFIDPGDITGLDKDAEINTAAGRDALQVDVPVSHGGTSSATIADTGIGVHQWFVLAKGFLAED